MNKLFALLTLLFLVVGVSQIAAQPTIYIDPDFALVDEGDETCLRFEVIDFSDIQKVRFSVRWDPDVVTMQPINPASFHPDMTNLTVADFVIDNVEGYFTFIWDVDDDIECPNVDVTLDDFESMFEACFVGINGYTDVTIGNDPEEIFVTRTSACPVPIGCFCEGNDGFIAVDNQPVVFSFPTVNVNEGESFCLDLTVEEFEDILSMQYTFGWDPTILQFDNIQCTPNLPNCSASNFNVNATDGWATFSWLNSNPAEGLTLPDGTDVVQVCFTAIGACPQNTVVALTNEPTNVEITNIEDPGQDIGYLGGETTVSINCFDPAAFTLDIPDASICPGEDFCLDVTVANFDDLVETNYTIAWNPGVIDLTSVSNLNTDLFNFNLTSLDQSGASNGFITVDWNDPTCQGDNLNDADVLMTLCFTSVGGGGVNTTVSITGDPEPVYITDECFGGDELPINTLNGFVDVCAPPGITLIAETLQADPGDDVCVAIEVQDFDGVLEMGLTIEWETSVLQYTGVQGFGLSDLSAANFDATLANFGALCLDWTDLSGLGQILSDGTVIFELCFTAIGPPLGCSAINFTGFPCDVNVVTTESNGFNVGINDQSGEVCLTNPFSFGVIVSDTASIPGDLVCVDVEVENFVSLEQLQFSINWDPSILQFFDLENPFTLPNFNEFSYDTTGAFNTGVLTVDWTSVLGNGNSLASGTTIFSLCFIIVGDGGQCSPVSITGTPDPIMVIPAGSGMNVGLVSEDGEICASPAISVSDELITGVDCPGDNAGGIDITVSGGSGFYTYQWQGPGIAPPDDMNEDQTALEDGTYFVTVTDAVFPFLTTVDTFIVGTTGLAPIADAGEDTAFPCGEITTNLDGSGSSLGGQYSYLWSPLEVGMGFVNPTTEDQVVATVVGSANYLLQVTDNSTGCTVSDTVFVEAAVAPAVELSVTDSITCLVDTVTLIGTGSSEGAAFTYQWSGPNIVPGTETLIDAQALQSGQYFLTVTNNQSGCESVDSVMVMENTDIPTTDAGADQLIDCLMASDTLDASASASGTNFVYEWLDPSMAFLSDEVTVIVSEAGTYQLTVTDTVTGCFGTDFVDVTADQDLPNADAGLAQVINCVSDTVTLDGSGTTGDDLSYLWLGPDITAGETTPIATVAAAGTYTLVVTDTLNGCEAFSDVEVTTDFAEPTADAGEALDALNCNVDQIQLDGSLSSTGNPGDFSYQWSTSTGTIDAGEMSLFPLVSGAGFYTIEVTNTANGCTAVDSVEVTSDEDLPIVNIGSFNGTELNCAINTIFVDTAGTSQGPEFNYVWSGPFCINVSALEIFCEGEFVLEVFNTNNGCSATDTIVITDNPEEVEAIADDATYNCFDDCFELDATGSSTGPNIVYQWTAAFGGVLNGGETTLMPTICAPGSYGLAVTDTVTGCMDEILVNVTPDTIPPVADAGMDGTINCIDDSVELDGSGSTAGNVTYTWTLNGMFFSNALMPIATEAGTYQLEVQDNDNGCTATDEVIVDENTQDPVADAGPTQELGCGDDSVVLDGSGSSAGPNIIYLWEVVSGVLDPNTTTLQSAIANDVGEYMLTVTDTLNGCTATAVVDVISVIDFDPATASIMGDACEISAILEGNLPEGTTGVWTTNSTATIQDPMAEITPVDNMPAGLNTFTWTLSAPDCPDYSSVTIEQPVEEIPVANNDLFDINEPLDSFSIDVLSNDLTTPGYTISIIGGPEFGSISDLKDGEFTYYLDPIFNGQIIIDYVICNDVCPDLCDTAFVQIDIEFEVELEDEVPNGITPNGDGVNDQLVFDILLIDPDAREQSEIIIFNRWGDIVYTDAPYDNDWAGTNQDGGELPSGTYYYVLRMDLGDGQIIKGHVTIMK